MDTWHPIAFFLLASYWVGVTGKGKIPNLETRRHLQLLRGMNRLLHWEEAKDKAGLQGNINPARSQRGHPAATASQHLGRRLLS